MRALGSGLLGVGFLGSVGAAFLVNRLGPYVYLPQPLIGPELAPRPTG